MSSLAAQLQNIASLDASRLTSKTGAPSSKSYLFPPKTAASHDLDAIFSLAQSGFEELLQLDPGFEEFEDSLFSEHARRTDRTMLNEAENKELDVVLGKCLGRLGRWVGIMAGGKCIEWLVRRFRIHEMNGEMVLQVFLPYHESPNFTRMLSILTIPQTSRYHAPFSALIKSPQSIPRSYITQAVSPARDKSLRLLTDVAGMVQTALRDNTVHRALLAFWSATMVELIEAVRAGQGVGEGLVKVLVEAFVTILETPKGGQDVNAAVYPPLILLTRSVRLADGPLLALLSALLSPSSGAEPTQRILTLLFILNDRQDWEGGLGQRACARLCKIKSLGNILISAIERFGFEDSVRVVVDALLDDVSMSSSILTSLIAYRGVQSASIDLMASRLLEIGSDSETSESTSAAAQQLLTVLVERHPSQVDQARLARVAAGKETANGLLNEDTSSMAFVNAYSADATARIRSIPPLLQAMGVQGQGNDNDIYMVEHGEEKESANEKIQLLLADQDESVLEALYAGIAKDAPTFITEITPAKYISAIAPQFETVKPIVAVRLHHLRFLADHLDHKSFKTADSVALFSHIILPSLLATAARPAFLKNEWTVIAKKGFFKDHEITGSAEFHKAISQAKSVEHGSMEQETSLNLVIANAISASLTASSRLPEYQTALVRQLLSKVPTTSMMAHLVVGRLLETLQGAQATALGEAVLATIDRSLRTSNMRDIDDSENPLSPALLRAIYSKPDDSRTASRALVSLMASFCKIGKSADASTNWFAESAYKTLTTSLYAHANSDILPPALSRSLLRSILASLREDALVFFASVWTDEKQHAPLQVAALRHATAFVKSYAMGTDFQMAMPSILVAFISTHRAVRDAAIGLIKVVNRSASDETKSYYAIDTFYGKQSEKVQLLKHGDLVRYLQAVIPALDDILVDSARLAALHSSVLSMNHGRGRKESGHRRSVIGSLMSHVSAIPLLSIRITLLKTLSGVHDTSVLRGALPLLTPLLEDSDETTWLASLPEQGRDQYLGLLLDAFTGQSASLLSDKESDAGKFVISLLGDGVQSQLASKLRELLLERFASSVFGALQSEQRVSYFGHIVKGQHNLEDIAQVSMVKAVLKRFELDVTSLILVIDDLSRPLSDSVAHPKKQKQDTNVPADLAEQAVADLAVLMESRDWKDVPGDAPLVAALMSVLSALLAKRQHVKEGVDYLEQEILGAILTLVEKIQDPSELQKAHIGVEVIIKVIRASTNPRTSQRALLVASELARLIPDAVLHNIMPIFTFMSASDLQRDDAYSFGVVEKTVSRIVPVMTKSLRDKAQNKLDLYNQSLTFISIFTDMAGRLPRHRTMPFFRHLTHSLGPSDFLAPVSMLLIDRTVTKAGRSAGLTLDLPLGVIASYDVAIRLDVVLEVVQEVSRLVPDLTNPDKIAFLSSLLGDHGDSERTLRQIQALLRFITAVTAQLAGRPCDQTQVEVIVQHLILLGSAVKSAKLEDTEIGQLVYSAIGGAMQLLSAENFLSIISKLLASEGMQDIKVALEIFVDRLPLIKTPIRTKCAATMGSIIDQSSALLSSQSALVADALAALRTVAATAVASEDPALSKAVPRVVEVVKSASSAGTSIAALSLLELAARHLSSRLIPHAQSLITVLLSAAQSGSTIAAQAFTTVSAVIEAIPTFIGSKQLISVVQSAIQQREENETSNKLLNVVSKKVPTKTLFPVVMELWKDVQSSGASAMEGFFHLLRLTLRNADKANLPTLVKPIFAFFLDVFDLRHRLQKRGIDQDVVNGIEESAIGSFLELVIKLNEVTFKPLFVRLYDWAVIDLSEGASADDARLVERKIVLLHVMMGLLQKFRHLLSPYIGVLLPHIEELLPAYASGSIQDEALWTLLLQVLAKSYEVDDGAFWTDQHHLKLIPMLTAQLPLFPNSPSEPIATVFSSLAGSTTSTPVLKALNTSLCLATRSDTVSVRLSALKAIDGVWDKQPDEMIQFVPETVSEFLSELLEDENSDVENMARKVLARIEGLTGSLKEYLE